MTFIILGIATLLLLIIFLLADKFTPYSSMMSSFKAGTYKKTIIVLTVLSIGFLGYGIYYEVTYQPPYLDIQVEGENYTVFGDIGEVGYYADQLVKKDEEVHLHLVTWDTLNEEKAEIVINYPSGTKETWETELTPLGNTSISSLTESHQIKGIYQLAPYTFKEQGNVQLQIQSGDETKELTIEVHD
ncbi:hypothetical protein Pryu01_00585 [Paraliobacillus ryukyuensis]|uniref:Uncharacterized protein n=1 Tax=Paraliobacillus ryukyuensis TaxID=200904 RepID=A0A366EIQ5_9BACI|nr:hypothetical protein [Paraliobacillus ryukyuensis]RBP01349.1 hypothetical protein DES48_10178 [Paraliobacillus ryukyuensis]